MKKIFSKFLKGLTVFFIFIIAMFFIACNDSPTINFEIENIDYMEEINTICVGDEITLEVRFIDVLNENELLGKIKWSTSDNSLATIDENGKLVATSDGKVIIYAEVEEVKKELEILIIKKNDFDFDVKINGDISNDFIEIEIGEELQLEAYSKDEKLEDVFWSVDNNNATIDENGKFTALKAGKTIISAEKNQVKKTIEVTINEIFDFEIKNNNDLINNELILEIGEELQLVAYSKEEKLEDVIWTASNDNVKIDVNGKLIALKEGKAEVTCEKNNLRKKISIVINGPFDFEISGSGYAALGKTIELGLLYKDGYDVSFKYTFDEKYIKESNEGLIAILCGETTITITELNNNVTKTYEVLIYEISEEAISIYLETLYNNLEVSSNIDFVKKYYDSEVEFQYSSNDPKHLDENGIYNAPILTIDSELCIIYYIGEEEFVSFLPIVIKGWGTEFDVVLKYLDDQIPEETQRTLYLPTTYFYYDTVIDWYCNGSLLKDGIFAFERNDGLNYTVKLKCVIKIDGKTEEKEYDVKCIMLDSNDKMLYTFDKYVNYFNENEVSGNIEIPQYDEETGAKILFSSWNEAVLSNEGIYTIPFNDMSITAFFTVILGEFSKREVITINVKGMNLSGTWDKVETFLDRINKEEIKTQKFYLYGWEEGYQTVLTKNIGYLPFYMMEEVKTTVDIVPDGSPLKPSRKRTSTNYITLHNTGMAHPTATAKGLNEYIHTTDRIASWHFSIDDYEAYQELKLDEVGWHAGDGSTTYGMIHYSESASKWCIGGGNNNSIGIEMCVYAGCDFNMVMRNTAKVVSKLLVMYNLTPSDIRQHYDFSGKNCPQVIREAGRWTEMIELISLEYFARTQLQGVKFEFISLTPEYLDNTGKIIKNPNTSPIVKYKVIVEVDGVKKEFTYESKLLPLK